MILYDEFGQLLGVDLDTVKLFGYGSINDFKEKVVDISDFFIKKDGYLYKTEHYHWIDYLNYSEEKPDKVLIKQNDLNAIKAKVIIKELYPVVELNNSEVLYLIDFIKEEIVDIKEQIADDKSTQETDKTPLDNLEEKIELDYIKIAEELDMDKELYDELLGDFIAESKNDLNLINIHIKNSDDKSALKVIRKLKNICLNLKLDLFLSLLDDMQTSVKSKSYGDIEGFIEVYKKELNMLSKIR